MSSIEIIVAVDKDGGFGKDGKIPWKCSDDMKHFKQISTDIGVCVMGKNTYLDMLAMQGKRSKDDITEKGILPDRVSYVVSSTLTEEDAPGATIVPDLRSVKNQYPGETRIAVIGGEKLFIQALSSCNVVHLTVIPKNYKCDRFFPVSFLADTNTFTTKVDGRCSIETKEVTIDDEQGQIAFITYSKLSHLQIYE